MTAYALPSFDTGFVRYYRGWRELRREDLGLLWEHYVLNEIQSRLPQLAVHYWRDTRGHEVDFVVARRSASPTAIECKWSTLRAPDLSGLTAFRRAHPKGRNFLVAADVDRPFMRPAGALDVEHVSLANLIDRLRQS